MSYFKVVVFPPFCTAALDISVPPPAKFHFNPCIGLQCSSPSHPVSKYQHGLTITWHHKLPGDTTVATSSFMWSYGSMTQQSMMGTLQVKLTLALHGLNRKRVKLLWEPHGLAYKGSTWFLKLDCLQLGPKRDTCGFALPTQPHSSPTDSCCGRAGACLLWMWLF